MAQTPSLLEAAKAYFALHGNCGSPHEQKIARQLEAAIAAHEQQQNDLLEALKFYVESMAAIGQDVDYGLEIIAKAEGR